MQLNNILDNLVTDMRAIMTAVNDYSQTPLIERGIVEDISSFPHISVSLDGMSMDSMIGAKIRATAHLLFTIGTRQVQGMPDYTHNNLIEDLFQYLLNDCTYKNVLTIDGDIETYNGRIATGDALLISVAKADMIIEYTKAIINA
jgi:hypothetical protein